ncbi:MAG: NYN domain-containing protein [Pacificimonas sp.]
MNKILILVDEANFAGTAYQYGVHPDLLALPDYLADERNGRLLMEMVVYIGLPPMMRDDDMPDDWRHKRDGKIRLSDKLRHNGIMTILHHGKGSPGNPGSLRANVDVLMAMDGIELALEMKPDTVVIVTGDADFHYLAEKLRRRGIRVEVASMESNVAMELKKSVNDFIDLREFFDEYCDQVADQD